MEDPWPRVSTRGFSLVDPTPSFHNENGCDTAPGLNRGSCWSVNPQRSIR